jgi:hypothetical protein
MPAYQMRSVSATDGLFSDRYNSHILTADYTDWYASRQESDAGTECCHGLWRLWSFGRTLSISSVELWYCWHRKQRNLDIVPGADMDRMHAKIVSARNSN